MVKPGSQNYDGGVPPAPRRKLTLNGPPVAGPSRGRHPMHGVGAQTSMRYCECGAKKKAGVCPRCEAEVSS